MSKFQVTLKGLREAIACISGYNKLVATISGKPLLTNSRYSTFHTDQPISILQILHSNGLQDALWALRCVEGADREIRLLAVWYARQRQHLMLDQRSLDALDVAERFANGLATRGELRAAEEEAYAAYATVENVPSMYLAEAAYLAVAVTYKDAYAAVFAVSVALVYFVDKGVVVDQKAQFIKMLNGEI